MPFLKPFCSGQIILLFSKYSSSLLNIILVNNLLNQLEIIRGNFFSVLESMYKKVSFSVDLPWWYD
jgi:hypothetical protein